MERTNLSLWFPKTKYKQYPLKGYKMIKIIIVKRYCSKMVGLNHKDCSQELRNLGRKHSYILILPSMSFFFKTKKIILQIIKHGCQINIKMRALWKWERKQQGFYSRQERVTISFNSVLENNNRIRIIFSIKFQGKWKIYLGILKLDTAKVIIYNNRGIKHNTLLYKLKKNQNWGVKRWILANK